MLPPDEKLHASCVLCRYGAFGSDCDGDILMSFDAHHPAVQAAYLITVLHLTFYIPNAFVIGRLFLCELAGLDVLALETGPFAALTVGLWAGLVAMMACVPREDVAGVFTYIIDLTGDLPIGFSCFALPAVLFTTAYKDQHKTLLTYTAYMTFALGALLVLICPVVDTYLFAKACESDNGCSAYAK